MNNLNNVKLATAVNITTTYAGQFAGEYIAAALLSASTIDDGGLTVKANIAYKEVIKKLATGNLVSPASCDFTPNSSVTLTERIIQPVELQVNLQLCKYDFVNDWESQSMGFGLGQSLPPKLVNTMEEYVKHSDNLITDIDTIFHALGVNATEPLDILVIMPDIGCIIEEHKFGDTVPMGSQDILPFEGMGRYKLQNLSGEFTVNRSSGDKKLLDIDSMNEIGEWTHDSDYQEQAYEFDWVINNPNKLREEIVQKFPSLDFNIGPDRKSPIRCAVSCSKGY